MQFVHGGEVTLRACCRESGPQLEPGGHRYAGDNSYEYACVLPGTLAQATATGCSSPYPETSPWTNAPHSTEIGNGSYYPASISKTATVHTGAYVVEANESSGNGNNCFHARRPLLSDRPIF